MGVSAIDQIAPIAPTTDPSADSLEERVIDAMLECIGRWGIAKTTVDDVARTAGISRATLYRVFPGGKEVAFEALFRRETGRFVGLGTERLAQARHLEDLLVVGITEAARFLAHHEALGYVLRHEPERVLPTLAVGRLDRAIAVTTAFTAPHLRRFTADDATAHAHAEWLVRIVLSYAVNPSSMVELTDEPSVRRFARTYLLPAFEAGGAH
jgi:AcrR family transcriptional regulator